MTRTSGMPLSVFRLLVVRALIVWGLTRAIFAVVLGLATLGRTSAATTPHVGLQVIILATLLVVVDVARRGERLLFANLGVGRRWIYAVAVGTMVTAEGALTTVRAVTGH